MLSLIKHKAHILAHVQFKRFDQFGFTSKGIAMIKMQLEIEVSPHANDSGQLPERPHNSISQLL